MYILGKLISSVPGARIIGDPSTVIRNVVSDSRAVESGDLFVALPGTRTDGRSFIHQAVRNGASAVVTSEVPVGSISVAIALVDDPISAIAGIAAQINGLPGDNLRLIGVTGTDGKTSVSYLISAMLNACGMPCAYFGTLGARFGDHDLDIGHTTPPPLIFHRALAWALEHGANAVSLEASSHALEQRRLEGVQFDAAVFTTFGRDHLDYHGSLDHYLASKMKLFEALGPQAPAVVNADQPMVVSSVATVVGERMITFSPSGKRADVSIIHATSDASGTKISLSFRGENLEISSPLLGQFQVENLTAAAAVGLALELRPTHIATGLGSVSRIPGRFEPIRFGGKLWALVDYAHTPGALERALLSAREVAVGRIIVVFGCGGERDKGKRPLMGSAAQRLADVVIITNDNPRNEDPRKIIDGITDGMKNGDAPHIQPDRREALSFATKMAKQGDLILVAGKGHESTQNIAGRIFDFSDAEELRKLEPIL